MKITIEGKAKILENINDLEESLIKLRENKASAYTQTGDTWHDNPYFNQLEQEEQRIISSMRDLQASIDTAEIIETPASNTDTVEIGSIVKCECNYGDSDEIEDEIYEIVGHGETDVSNGKIHYESLVAKNIMGHKIGDSVSFNTPGGMVKYTIVKLYPNWESAKLEG